MIVPRLLVLLIFAGIPSLLFSNTLYFPQVAFGGGYSTSFVIVNTGTTTVSSRVEFFHQGGSAGIIQTLAGQLDIAATKIAEALNLPGDAQLANAVLSIKTQAASVAQIVASLQAQMNALDKEMAGAGPARANQQQQLTSLQSQLQTALIQINTHVLQFNAVTSSLNSERRLANPLAPINFIPTSRAINVPPGGSTRVSFPSTGPLTVGWGRVAAESGTVQGVATLDLRADSDALIATSGVLGIEAANSFVLPVDVTSTVRTGIAIANVKDVPLNIRVRLLGEDGTPFASANEVRLSPLGARLQLADFVTSLFPQLGGTTFNGTLLVEAATGTEPNSLAAAGLSEKEEGTLSALPGVPNPGSSGSTGKTLYFPQVVLGGGYSTDFVIMNTGATDVFSRFNFYDQSGGNRVAYSAPINVPAAGSTRFKLPNTGPLTVFWGELAAPSGTLKGAATLELRAESGALIATSALLGVEARNTFVLPVDVTSTASTGIAIANVTDAAVGVGVRLFKEDGSLMAAANDARLGPLGPRRQIAEFVTSMFPQLAGRTFKGTLVVEAAAAPADSLAATVVSVKELGSPSETAVRALTELPRNLTAAEHKVVDAVADFSLGLWGKLNTAQRGSNVFVSPLSVLLALGMTLNGAANRTFDEMRSALQLNGASEQEINEGFRSLIALLTSIDPAVKLQIANSIWYRQGFSFLQSFKDTNTQYFDAEVRGLDFSDVNGSLAAINGWVDAKTEHKIPTIIGAGELSDAVMFLINAIYFKGNWREKFDPDQTRDALFHLPAGTSQSVPLMHRQAKMSYTESQTYQAVDLPYGNSAFTMTVVLPKEGTDIESFAPSLTSAGWRSLVDGLQSNVDVDLSLPKLKLSYERTLNDDLKALGMVSAFTAGAADFTRMSPTGRNLVISKVKQKAFVDINEQGTEAAAATVVTVVQVCACQPPVKIMRVDRPYIFAIRERLSGTLLFMGKIVGIP